MIYRGPGSFDLAPRPPSPVSLSQSSCVSPVELTDGRVGEKGAKAYDGEKAWTSINHSLLSVERDQREVKRSVGHDIFCTFHFKRWLVYVDSQIDYRVHQWNKLHYQASMVITINVPLFKKLRDIIFFWWENHFMSHFEGHFEGVKKAEAPSKCPEKWLIKWFSHQKKLYPKVS